MSTNRCLVMVVAVLTLLAVQSRADEKSHKAAAETLLKLMDTDKNLQLSIDQMLTLQTQQQPQLAPYKETMKRFFSKYMSWESLKDDFIKIYTDEFSEQELKEITAFYRTPVGQKMIQKTPALLTKCMQLGADRVRKNQAELLKMLEDAKNRKDL